MAVIEAPADSVEAVRVGSSSVDARKARDALATVVPRLTALIRSVRHPAAPAVGEWSAADVAVHLAHAWEILPMLARGDGESPLSAPSDLAMLTTAMVRDDSSRDLQATATRIEVAAAAYLATPIADGPRPWLVKGTAMPSSAFSCHLLNESLVHGFDIARADRQPWRIEPEHAGMAIMGFLLPALAVVDSRFAVDERYTAGVHACFDMRVRGVSRYFLVFDDGAVRIEPPSQRKIDWHISAAPDALFLQLWSRVSPWRPFLTGRVTAWGTKPWLGLRLPRMMRNP